MEQEIRSELFAKRIIKDKIVGAKNEILIGSSRYLNDELVELLHLRAEKGVRVKLIIQDSLWARKLDRIDFSHNLLISTKINEEADFQLMHFLVFDDEVVIHAMEKWSSYSSSPSKGVVITEDMSTVAAFTQRFYEMFILPQEEIVSEKSSTNPLFKWLSQMFHKEYSSEEEVKEIPSQEISESMETPSISKGINEFNEILDSIVTIDIEDFNRDELRVIGERSAHSVRGNAQVLARIMDSLYGSFLQNIHNHLTQKENLKTKIDLKVDELINLFKQHTTREVVLKEKERIAKQKEYDITLSEHDKEIEKKKLSIEQLEKEKIPQKEKEIKEKEEEWLTLEKEKLPQDKSKWYWTGLMYLAYSILPFGLLVFSFFFYASSAYNILFTAQDLDNGDITNALFFQPKFFSLTLDKGLGALIPVLLFSLIPLGAALVHDFKKEKLYKRLSIGSIIGIDLLVALGVIHAVYNEELDVTGEEVGFINWTTLLEFLTIFIFGIAPLLIFIYMRKRWVNFHKQPKISDEEKRAEVEKRYQRNDILFLNAELTDYQRGKKALKENIIDLTEQKKQTNINIAYLDAEIEKSINGLKEEEDAYVLNVQKRAGIYKNGIDNNTIYLPLRALKDRFNIFLEGWNNWLYQEWAENKAEYYAHEANQVMESWLAQNMQTQNQSIRQITNDQ